MNNKKHRGPAWAKILAIALVAAALAAAWRYTPLSELVTAERVGEWARAIRAVPWAPIASVLAYIPAAFVLFPRPLLTLFNVIAFGPWLGFAYSMSGIIVAALVTYYVGRAMPPDTVRRVAGEKFERVTKVLREHTLVAVLAVRLTPVAPFAIEGVIAGALRINVWHFLIGTFLGMTPGVLAETIFGDQLMTALEDPSQINYWLIAAALLLLATLAFFVARWLRRQ